MKKKVYYEKLRGGEWGEYRRIHKEYTLRGLSIRDGEEVVPTDWAFQNGVVKVGDHGRYYKVRNSARRTGMIMVRKDGNSQSEKYWAGFWKTK